MPSIDDPSSTRSQCSTNARHKWLKRRKKWSQSVALYVAGARGRKRGKEGAHHFKRNDKDWQHRVFLLTDSGMSLAPNIASSHRNGFRTMTTTPHTLATRGLLRISRFRHNTHDLNEAAFALRKGYEVSTKGYCLGLHWPLSA